MKATTMKGMTGETLMAMLELRLDNVIFRLGLHAQDVKHVRSSIISMYLSTANA